MYTPYVGLKQNFIMQTIKHFSFVQYKLDQRMGLQKGSLSPKAWLSMILVYTRKCHISAPKKN